jgi:hypothetical protein
MFFGLWPASNVSKNVMFRKLDFFPKYCILLETLDDEVQKHDYSKCNTPSSEPFRINFDLLVLLTSISQFGQMMKISVVLLNRDIVYTV